MKVSILVCSFEGSKYLERTLSYITNTFPKDQFDFEILVDSEKKKTGLSNTPARYMKLFEQSTGDIIVKSDDDVRYYDNWFQHCYKYLCQDDKIAYIGPISHYLMIKLGIQHATSPRFPIEPDGVNAESVVSGMCWVFKRKLWVDFPYTMAAAKSWRLDSNYSAIFNKVGLKTCALNGSLIEHLGQDRFKGICTDLPGKKPSRTFVSKHKNLDFKIK